MSGGFRTLLFCFLSLAANAVLMEQNAFARIRSPDRHTFPLRRSLEVGATVRVRLPGADRLRISREGVIHVRRGDGDHWLLTGLSRGVVILHPESSDSDPGGSSVDMVVEVVAAQSRSARLPNVNHAAVQKDDFAPCESLVDSTGAVRFRIMMSAMQESSTGGIAPSIKGDGHFARIIGTSVASGGGVVGMARGMASIASFDNDGRMQAKIVAEPVVAVFPGSESVVRSGGEFRTEGSSMAWDPVVQGQRASGAGMRGDGLGSGWTAGSGWKEYGLSLRTFWAGCQRGRAVIQYEIWLTQRVSGRDDHLLAGKITGKKLLDPERLVFGGAIDFALDAGTENGSWWINRIPLVGHALGRLFSRKGEELGKSKMSVWLALTVPDGGGEESHSELQVEPDAGSAASESFE